MGIFIMNTLFFLCQLEIVSKKKFQNNVSLIFNVPINLEQLEKSWGLQKILLWTMRTFESKKLRITTLNVVFDVCL